MLASLKVDNLSDIVELFSKNNDKDDEVTELKTRLDEKDSLIAELVKRDKQNTIQALVTKWTDGEKFSLPKVTITKLTNLLPKLDAKDVTVLASTVDELLTVGLIEVEEGSSKVTDLTTTSDEDVVKEFTELVSQVKKNSKCGYEEALNLAKLQNPKLANRYIEAQRDDA